MTDAGPSPAGVSCFLLVLWAIIIGVWSRGSHNAKDLMTVGPLNSWMVQTMESGTAGSAASRTSGIFILVCILNPLPPSMRSRPTVLPK